MKRLLVALAMACCLPVWGDGGGRLESVRADADFALTADAGAAQWAAVPGVTFAAGPMGQPEPKHRTEVRSRWTNDYLYVLFVCPYEQLYLKPAPDTVQETNKLWKYDVAEVFVGADFDAIHRYRELQVSPRGARVDLDI